MTLRSSELASKEREERETSPRKADVTFTRKDSESKSLSDMNNTDSLHSSQDSLEQGVASHDAGPADASPGASPDASPDASPHRPLPWNGKTA